MNDDSETGAELRLPRMTRAMKTLAAVLAAIWLMEVLLGGTGIGGFAGPMGPFEVLALVPASVLQRGMVWQLVTHALVHDPQSGVSVAFTAAALWFVGSPMEQRWGTRAVFAVMGAATVAGGVCAVLAGLVDARIYHGIAMSPAGAVSALLAAWCLVHGETKTSLFGLATLTGRQILGLAAAITVFQFVWQRSGSGVAAIVGYGVGWAAVWWLEGRRPRVAKKRDSGPRLRVIRGGGGSDLPN